MSSTTWMTIPSHGGGGHKIQDPHPHVVVDDIVKIAFFLPEGYFGNAVQGADATATSNELLSHGLGWAAQQLSQMIAAQTHEETKNYYVNWLKCPRLLKKGGAWTNTSAVGSSPRFNVYGNDFGWGKPVAVRAGLDNKFDGKLTIFPGEEEGSIDIEIRLTPDALHAMENDAEFMQVVTVN